METYILLEPFYLLLSSFLVRWSNLEGLPDQKLERNGEVNSAVVLFRVFEIKLSGREAGSWVFTGSAVVFNVFVTAPIALKMVGQFHIIGFSNELHFCG